MASNTHTGRIYFDWYPWVASIGLDASAVFHIPGQPMITALGLCTLAEWLQQAYGCRPRTCYELTLQVNRPQREHVQYYAEAYPHKEHLYIWRQATDEECCAGRNPELYQGKFYVFVTLVCREHLRQVFPGLRIPSRRFVPFSLTVRKSDAAWVVRQAPGSTAHFVTD
jgi:hypothetical protein